MTFNAQILFTQKRSSYKAHKDYIIKAESKFNILIGYKNLCKVLIVNTHRISHMKALCVCVYIYIERLCLKKIRQSCVEMVAKITIYCIDRKLYPSCIL